MNLQEKLLTFLLVLSLVGGALLSNATGPGLHGASLTNLVDDTSPTLGGNLDGGNFNLTNITYIDGAMAVLVRKGSPGTITKGQVVYISGFNTGQGVPEVELAQANSSATMPGFGMANESITNSTNGYVITRGRLSGIDTSGLTVGDTTYISSTVAGGFTTTRPSGSTDLVQAVATTLRVHATLGVCELAGADRPTDVSNVGLFANGTELLPSVSNIGDPDTGAWFPGLDVLGFSAGGIEGYRITESGGLITHAFSGNVGINVADPDSRLVVGDTGDTAVRVFGNDFVGLAVESYRNSPSDKALINLYSSRGTQALPLALLSGDLMGGIVFRGKKNTTAGIVEFGTSAKIEAVAEEDFTDTAQGTKLSFLTTAIGTSVAAERMRITNTGHIIQQELLVDPGTGDLASNFEVAIYNKNNKLVFAYNNGGTITYVSLALDGSATTWVHSTTAP